MSPTTSKQYHLKIKGTKKNKIERAVTALQERVGKKKRLASKTKLSALKTKRDQINARIVAWEVHYDIKKEPAEPEKLEESSPTPLQETKADDTTPTIEEYSGDIFTERKDDNNHLEGNFMDSFFDFSELDQGGDLYADFIINPGIYLSEQSCDWSEDTLVANSISDKSSPPISISKEMEESGYDILNRCTKKTGGKTIKDLVRGVEFVNRKIRCTDCKKNYLGKMTFSSHMKTIHFVDIQELEDKHAKLPVFRDPHNHCIRCCSFYLLDTIIPHQFETCKATYANKHRYKRHLKESHNITKPNKELAPDVDDPDCYCCVCDKKYTSRRKFINHLNACHKI